MIDSAKKKLIMIELNGHITLCGGTSLYNSYKTIHRNIKTIGWDTVAKFVSTRTH